MDFGKMQSVNGYLCGDYAALESTSLPPIYLAWSLTGGEPTEVFHNNLKQRYDAGESTVVNAMQELVDLTDESLVAVKTGDHARLSELMDRNFDIRQSISDLNPHHVEMVRAARACGVSAKYAGSGGAIVGVCTEDKVFESLKQHLRSIGCEVVRPVIT